MNVALLAEVRRQAARVGKTRKAFFEGAFLARRNPKARPCIEHVADMPEVKRVKPSDVDVADRWFPGDFLDEHR